MNRMAPAWLLCAALLIHCSESPLTGNGGSSETINAKLIISDTTAAVIIDTNETAGLLLRIYSTDYRPFEKRGFADSVIQVRAQAILWQAPNPGNYNFLLTNDAGRQACFIRDRSLEPGAADTVACLLEPQHTLAGTIVGSDSAHVGESFIVAIYGSPFFACSDSTGRFTMGAVPPRDYAINVRSTGKRLFVASARYSITADMFGPSIIFRIMAP